MLWQPAPQPAQPRQRTPRQKSGGRLTFRARVLALLEHVSAVNAPMLQATLGMNRASIHPLLWQLVQRGDLVQVRVYSRRHRYEYRRNT